MVNIKMFVVILYICLLSLPSWCEEGDEGNHNEWCENVDVLEEDGLQYGVGCEETHLLAPGFSIYKFRDQLSSHQLQDFYINCIGHFACNVLKDFITEVRSLRPYFHTHNINIFSKDIIICLPKDYFSRPNLYEKVTISKHHPDYGFILRDHSQQKYGIKITIKTWEGQIIYLEFYYKKTFSSSKGDNIPMSLSGGLEAQCVYIEDTYTKPQVWVPTVYNRVILLFPRCSNTGQFAISYYRSPAHDATYEMPSDWNFTPDHYTRLDPSLDCINKCFDRMAPTLDPATTSLTSVTKASNTVGGVSTGVSGAVIGVSVVAGLLLAAILVIVVIFLLWKRNIVTLPLKSTAVREAAPTPPKQKEDNPSEGTYSQPYDYVRTPDILDNRNASNGNLYDEVKEDRKRHPLVSGSSLHIEENDLYSGSGDGVPQRGPRDSAGVYIVENDEYDP